MLSAVLMMNTKLKHIQPQEKGCPWLVPESGNEAGFTLRDGREAEERHLAMEAEKVRVRELEIEREAASIAERDNGIGWSQ